MRDDKNFDDDLKRLAYKHLQRKERKERTDNTMANILCGGFLLWLGVIIILIIAGVIWNAIAGNVD